MNCLRYIDYTECFPLKAIHLVYSCIAIQALTKGSVMPCQSKRDVQQQAGIVC